ncbi:PilZ domain-containing protein [Saccharophagus sp. K07]|uniref:PilZ domain-containing protein n=1 Tax=Saccharophagus sp. K07 TaxID=2283636 RepID=UPI00351C4420
MNTAKPVQLPKENSRPAWWTAWFGLYREWLQQLLLPTEESVMRRYIRHPSDIPIDFQVDESEPRVVRRMRDVSAGGLCFTADRPMQKGARIRINIPLLRCAEDSPPDMTESFKAEGIVAWCRKEGENYAIGVQFADQSTQFGLRMVEQVCHIEHYRYDVLQEEGRVLSSEEAAREWVERYAAEFPR